MEQRISILILGIILTCHLSQQALIVTSTQRATLKDTEKEGKTNTPSTPQIYQLKIRSDIRNRFANTSVTSRVRNYASEAKQVVFSVVLPETGFISGFVMEIGGKNYTAYVKEKEEARRIYDKAVASGLGAAHVAKSTRDSNRFTVTVNVEAEAKVAFYLSYEQLLQWHDNHYEQVININPGQPVKDLSVEVVIVESRKISYLNAPPLRSGNEIGKENGKLEPRAVLEIFNDTSAVVRFTPNVERQKELAHLFGTKEDEGLSGQFVIQYDVERDPQGGEVLIQDGYFVHFFAPTNLKPLPKLVVFVLDTSGSMWGDKLEQVKQAMANILEQLNEHDSFHLVEFNSKTRVWNLNNFEESVWYPNETVYTLEARQILQNTKFPTAYLANADNIKKAKVAVSNLKSDGATSMFGALEVALHLVQQERQKASSRQPMILFLTDGEPTDYSTDEIMKNITEFNSGPRQSPIFSLSFGAGADKQFLQSLAVRNFGFSRHIYEAADASLQLQDFYRQISSPLLSGISFKYEPSVTSLTKTDFPIHFGGSEIVVCGCYEEDVSLPVVEGCGIDGEKVSLAPTVSRSISNVERIWAYLSISQLLMEKEYSQTKKEKALQLALKYSFVTSVSSLVVVKPNDTSAIDTEDASSSSPQYTPLQTNAAFQYDYEEEEDMVDSIVSYERASTSLPSNEADNPMPDLPWLVEVLNDGWLSAPNGTYKLGANETFSDNVPCPKSPLNEEGLCSLLHQCVNVHSLLNVSKDFFDHLCVLRNEFAGICCPRN